MSLGKTYCIIIPETLTAKINTIFSSSNRWPLTLTRSWKEISQPSIIGILTSVKTQLLNFLLELSDEFCEGDDINILHNPTQIEAILEKTILSGTVNINMGSGSIQTVKSGDNMASNISQGNSESQMINRTEVDALQRTHKEILSNIDGFELQSEQIEDLKIEISRVEA